MLAELQPLSQPGLLTNACCRGHKGQEHVPATTGLSLFRVQHLTLHVDWDSLLVAVDCDRLAAPDVTMPGPGVDHEQKGRGQVPLVLRLV